jgi:hypothetical protein
MGTLKSLMIVSALLVSGASLAVAQNSPTTGGQRRQLLARPAIPQRQAPQHLFRLELLAITGHGTTECT